MKGVLKVKTRLTEYFFGPKQGSLNNEASKEGLHICPWLQPTSLVPVKFV